MNWNKYTLWEKLIAGIIILAFIFVALCLVSWLGMLVWNAIVPPLLGLGTITFWQAMGVKLLITFIFTPLKFKWNTDDD